MGKMNMRGKTRFRASLATAVVAALPAALLPVLLGAQAGTAAAITPADGLSQATAAGSCWEIKQDNPGAPSGVYWLTTPALQAPEQFYCDQTTNGGGWVLLGRGRQGWTHQYNGVRTAADVRNTISGPEAFSPAQLPSKTIDGLLNGGRVDALTDGIRLRRATNTAGSAWQEVRFKFQRRDRWAWTFPAEHFVTEWFFDGQRGVGGRTVSFGADTSFRRVDTNYPSTQNFLWGFSYGTNVPGYTSPTSYLWSSVDGRGGARPFTQMYVRPQLRRDQMTWPAIPAEGTAKQELRNIPRSGSMPTVWGVNGLANGIDSELNTEAQAFAQVGNTVFVGGNFRYVQRSETGLDQTEQPYVAGFDVNTGEWVSTFRPTLNGQVKALAALPDGRLAVGGQFNTVNGQPQSALALLDPVTGALSGAQIQVEDRTTGGVVAVRGLHANANYLYLAGSFTHLVQMPYQVFAQNAGRIAFSNGRPDSQWNPFLNGTSVGVSEAPGADRIYFSGYFKQTGSVYTPSATAISPEANAPLAGPQWQIQFSQPANGRIWQFDVQEAGGRVYTGGSEHMLFGYDRETLVRQSGSITKSGGDIQTIHADGPNLFAGCHCGDFTYQDAYTWSDIGANWTQGDSIATFGLWDAATGNYIPEFSPNVKGRRGYGAWGMFTDSLGNFWVGGDYHTSIASNGSPQWSGGFIRFAARDHSAPSTPGNLRVTASTSTTVTLGWNPSTDDHAGALTYEILEDDKVIATTQDLAQTVARKEGTHRYFVRAADVTGNRSASTSELSFTSPAPEQIQDLVRFGQPWAWRFDSTAPPVDWRAVTFDDSAWPRGNGALGFGSAQIGTNIGVGAPSPRPLTAQFRKPFTVTNATAIARATVSVIADDGVVVYLNGEEIGRQNLPAGAVSQTTYATAAPRTNTARLNPYVITIPGALLNEGTNVLTAQTHVNYRSTPDLSFDLQLVAELGEQEFPDPPAAPVVTASGITANRVNLTWPTVTGATLFRILRDGVEVGTAPAGSTSYTDTSVQPDHSYSYVVVAMDRYNQEAPSVDIQVQTPPQLTMVAQDSSWRWRYADSAPAADWTTVTFDDTTWNQGGAQLGFGSGGIVTDISVGAPTRRPVTAQFRQQFQIDDVSIWSGATVSVVADDGVVVWVNGIEVGRANLPAGTLTSTTTATVAPRTTAARANRVTFPVPGAALRGGVNVVTAQVHANYRATPDLNFDLGIEGIRGTRVLPDPPAAPVVTATVESHRAVVVNWGEIAGASMYRILRDGVDVGTAQPGTVTTFRDASVAPETDYRYQVAAVDQFGQETLSLEALVTTPEDPTVFVMGGEWRWRYASTAPEANWASLEFDDSLWATGLGKLGFGSVGLGTDISTGVPSPRPVSAQYRKAFEIAQAETVGSLRLTFLADDGVVIYVNGVEVSRTNLPANLAWNSFATAAPRSAAAAAAPVVVTIPGALLRDGRNVIAAETHLNYRSTPDTSFDMSVAVVR